MNDKDREDLIEAYRLMLVLEPDADMKRIALLRMERLIAARSPCQIRKMEAERGLRVS